MAIPKGLTLLNDVPSGLTLVPEGLTLVSEKAPGAPPLLHRAEPGTVAAEELRLTSPPATKLEQLLEEARQLSVTMKPGTYSAPVPQIGMPRRPIGEVRLPSEGDVSPMTQFFRRTGITRPGVLPKIAGAVEIPFEALSTVSRLTGGYEPGEGGPQLGDIAKVAMTATTPQLLAGGLPLSAARVARTARLLKESPALRSIVKDITEAMGRGEGGLIEPEAALTAAGLGRKEARTVVNQIKGNNLLEAVQSYQGALKELGRGAKTEKAIIQKAEIAKLAEDGVFDIMKSLGVTDEAAQVFVRHFAMSRTEPLETIGRLATTPAQKLAEMKLAPNAITNPFLPVRGVLREKITKSPVGQFLIPETVMSLDQNALRVHNAALETYRSMDQSTYMFQQTINKIFKGMTRESREQVGKVLDGVLKPNEVPAFVRRAADKARIEILDTLAGPKWHNLKLEGRYLSNYFPWIFDRKRGHAPHDLLEAIAMRQVGGSDAYAALSELDKGKALDAAYRMLKKQPKQYFFGNISLHRLSEKGPVTHDAAAALNYYVHGAVRKYYMDRFYTTARRLTPGIEDADIQRYTMDYIQAFRGLTEGPFRKTSDTMRTWQAWAKLGLPNLTSPLLNLSQTSINIYSVVGAPTLSRAIGLRFTAEGRKLLQKSGVFLDVSKHEITEPIGKAMQSGSQALLFLFNKSEKFNREIAWLSGYLRAKDQFPKASFAALNREGRQLVDRTQFVFASPGRPAFYHQPIGAALGQFKLFGINQLRFITSLKGPERTRFALALALHGGMKGLPGTQTLVKTYAGMEALQWVKDQDLPDALERGITGGVPAMVPGGWAPGLEYDVGVGFVPTSLKELLPPSAGPFVAAGHLVKGLQTKDIEELERGVTEGVRNIPGGVGLERWRQVVLAAQRGGVQFSPSDVIKELKGKEAAQYGMFGGKSQEEIAAREQDQFARRTQQEFANARKYLRHELRIAGVSNDVDRATKAIQEARDSGILWGWQIKGELFYPNLLDRLMSAPPMVKATLWSSETFRKQILKEAEMLGSDVEVDAKGNILKVEPISSVYRESVTGTLTEAAAAAQKKPMGKPKWPYKGAYSSKVPAGLTLMEE